MTHLPAPHRETLQEQELDFHGRTPENFDDPHTPVVEGEGHRAPSSPAPAGTVSGGAGQPENRTTKGTHAHQARVDSDPSGRGRRDRGASAPVVLGPDAGRVPGGRDGGSEGGGVHGVQEDPPVPADLSGAGGVAPEPSRGEQLVQTVTALDELAEQVDALMNTVSVVASRCPDVLVAADLFVEVQRLRGVGRAIRNVRKRLP